MFVDLASALSVCEVSDIKTSILNKQLSHSGSRFSNVTGTRTASVTQGGACGGDAVLAADGLFELVSLSDSEPVDSVTDAICDRTKTKSETDRPRPLHTT